MYVNRYCTRSGKSVKYISEVVLWQTQEKTKFISTINKIRFDPTNPCEDDIDIRDIAHALSMMTRANGHFIEFYSVARHSVNCALEATARGYSKRVALFCLLHDSAESYIGDMTRPLKMHFPLFSEYEKKTAKGNFFKICDA